MDSPAWYDRVKVLRPERMLLCGIEKNGITVQEAIARLVHGLEPSATDFFALAPHKAELPLAEYQALLADPAWRKAVVYRDPMERFLSAYNSKCLRADPDGFAHCEAVFRLRAGEVSLLEVAKRLGAYGR